MNASFPSVPRARDLLTVDLRGMKPALIERASGEGVPASKLVRRAVAELLREGSAHEPGTRALGSALRDGRVRVSFRLSQGQYDDLHSRAATAGLPLGGYVMAVTRRSIEPPRAVDLAACTAALVRSNAELSTLSRNMAHLTALLGQGAVRAAQEYRQSLDALDTDVRAHLALASGVLAQNRESRPRA